MKIYFSRQELNPHDHPVCEDTLSNLEDLAKSLSIVREAYGKPMIITSGLRSVEDQRRIYKNAQKIPMGSMHLRGGAADVSDRDGSLAAFCAANVPLLERARLWLEDPTYTRGWVHFQITPPLSKSRFFKP